MKPRSSGRGAVMQSPFDVATGANESRRRRVLQRFCPQCHGPLQRVPRRKFDRIISWVISLQRYRCCAMDCGWLGNLRVKKTALSIRRLS
ncbi:MAG: hypothetical protein R3E64_18065 [Halioglobus sp.]